tara:strand:+ start:39 stop:833 length:795 start_codon:yes stop_codon:yes gene_type:complete
MKYPNVLGKDFKTKPKAYKHFQTLRDGMVANHQLGERHFFTEETIIKKSQMDQLFKDYFLCKNPEFYERKIGLGIQNWFFGYDSHGSVSLCVKQIDRPPKHDSSKCEKCLTGKRCLSTIDCSHIVMPNFISAKIVFTCFGRGVLINENPMHRVKMAARLAIRPQIKSFRDSVRDECQKCGVKEYGLGLEVDHVINFMDIFNSFIKTYEEKILLESVSKEHSGDVWYFNNEKLKEEWRKYHAENAKLQLLCKPCHKDKTYKRKAA